MQKTLLRFLSVLCSFLLLCSSSCAESSLDWSAYSNDDIIAILKSLKQHMVDTGLIITKNLKKGTYSVGEDLPAGLYLVSPFGSTYACFDLLRNSSDSSDSYVLHTDNLQSILELRSGDTLTITVNAISLITYYDGYLYSYTNMSPDNTLPFSSSIDFDTSDYSDCNYKTLQRYLDQYIGSKISFSGTVQQIFGDSSDWSAIRVSTKDFSNEDFYVYISPDAYPSIRILEDDLVTVYGVLRGEEKFETVLGGTLTILCVAADYISIYE